jgi:TIR domain
VSISRMILAKRAEAPREYPYVASDHKFRIFASFSTVDNMRTATAPEGEVNRFTAELCDMFARVSGLHPGVDFEIFRSFTHIAPGDAWKAVLGRELARANAFLPILSPGFLNSDWCAKEWGAFHTRSQGFGGFPTPCHGPVVPVHWMDCSPLPPEAANLQLSYFDGRDNSVGTRRLMVSQPQRYDEELEQLARQLRRISQYHGSRGEDFRPPPGANIDIDGAVPMFSTNARLPGGAHQVYPDLRVADG